MKGDGSPRSRPQRPVELRGELLQPSAARVHRDARRGDRDTSKRTITERERHATYSTDTKQLPKKAPRVLDPPNLSPLLKIDVIFVAKFAEKKEWSSAQRMKHESVNDANATHDSA